MLKQELRTIIKERKRQFTQQQLRELSLPAIKKLMNHQAIKGAKTIMLYYSMADEVDTHDLIEQLIAMNKIVLLPKMIDNHTIEARLYKSKDDLKEAPSYHILEPIGNIFTNLNQIETIIVPGVSFDKNGNRLGRGKGYYDRFLSQVPNAYKIGLCFDFQIMDDIPAETTDIKMNEVIDNSIKETC